MTSLVFYILTRQLSGGDEGQSLTFILISLTLRKLFQRSLESSLTLFLTYSYVITDKSATNYSVLALIFTEFIYFTYGFAFMLLFGFISGELCLVLLFYTCVYNTCCFAGYFRFVYFLSSASVYVGISSLLASVKCRFFPEPWHLYC